jgi:hypothetical protein
LISQENLVERLRSQLSSADLPNFELVSVEPHAKDGGVFVRFKYANLDCSETALEDLQLRLREHVEKQGGLPSWVGFGRGDVWVVKGKPWREVSTL